jgi:signal transduction histidine kinase
LIIVERQTEARVSCATGGIARRLPPEVAAGLGAISRVARALNQPGTLEELAAHALAEMRQALELTATVLYLPDGGGRPVLRRFLHDAPAVGTQREIVFEEEAWRLAVASGHPLVFHESASWLVANPFEPEARFWLVLPMVANDDLVGVVMAARPTPVDLDPTTLTVLTLLGEQLSAGIATARLRQDLQRAELDRERMRLAAEVHDGLAQDLALAMRELALLELDLDAETARASRERLREAVAAAHQIVRARLVELSSSAPLGGLRTALADVCDRFARRGMAVDVDAPGELLAVEPATTAVVMRILNEALTNAEKHAGAARVNVRVTRDDGALELRVEDDGAGFDVAAPPGAGDGHLGLTVMHQRAADAGGSLDVHSEPGAGTVVALRIPLALGPPERLRSAHA